MGNIGNNDNIDKKPFIFKSSRIMVIQVIMVILKSNGRIKIF